MGRCRCIIWYQAVSCIQHKSCHGIRSRILSLTLKQAGHRPFPAHVAWALKRGCGIRSLQQTLTIHVIHAHLNYCTYYCTSHQDSLHALRICRHKSTFLLKLPILLWASFSPLSALMHATNSVQCTRYIQSTPHSVLYFLLSHLAAWPFKALKLNSQGFHLETNACLVAMHFKLR